MTNLLNNIVIYQTDDGLSQVEIQLRDETFWLSQVQMATLFEVDSDTIGYHLKNIYNSSELKEQATTEDSSVVRREGKRQVNRNIKFYNLDAIISVGYRVNSKKGTQFRIWASNILKQYLVHGYALNKKLLFAQRQKFTNFQQAVASCSRLIQKKNLTEVESQSVLSILEKYSYALMVLDDYDHQCLQITGVQETEQIKINYDEAMKQIELWRKREELGELFGNEKDNSFKSSLGTIYQTFDGKELYPSIEEKAANLLYFIVKNHSFFDGNKRIAAALFAWFLARHNYLYNSEGEKRIADNALVAFTLLIAESNPEEKNTIIKVIINLINDNNL